VLGAVAPDAETHGSQRIEDATVTVIDLDNVRAAGVKPAATRAVDRLSRPGLAAFWIHLDADVLADAIMPAVDYRMPDGLSWEAIAEVLRAAVGSGHAAGGRRHDLQSNARWRRVDRAGVGKHARQGARA
jgi:arginase